MVVADALRWLPLAALLAGLGWIAVAELRRRRTLTPAQRTAADTAADLENRIW